MVVENKINILLVEDNQTDVKIIHKAFDKVKFVSNLYSVGDGQEALDFIQNKGKYDNKSEYLRPDILLLDVNMPVMDGYTFVRELKLLDEYRDIPIIVFTTKEGMHDIFRIEGVDDYIQKSLDATSLIARIKKYVNKEI